MRKIVLLSLFTFFVFHFSVAQNVGIGTTTPNASAQLDVTSTDKGLLIPRLALTNTTSALPLSAFVAGMVVYNTAAEGDVTPGYYGVIGSAWVRLVPGSAGWLLTGNAGTNSATHFIGTTDNNDLVFKVNNFKAGQITASNGNTSFGLFSNPGSGISNSAFGNNALFNNTTGRDNVAVGYLALFNNTTGGNNVANGSQALYSNTTGGANVAIGLKALYANTAGIENTAVGIEAGENNQGSNNVFLGNKAGRNETGSNKLYITNSATTAANTLIYGEFDTKKLSFDAKVGIGTTTPNAPLQFNNTEANRKIVLWDNTNDDHQFFGFGHNNNILRYQINSSGSNPVFYAGNGASSSTELMRIAGNGNVGIGNPSPNATLDIISNTTTTNGLKVIKNYAVGTNSNVAAIYGENIVDNSASGGNSTSGVGVEGKGGSIGVQGIGEAFGTAPINAVTGVFGLANSDHAGTNYGVRGVASGGLDINMGVRGFTNGSGVDNYGLHGNAEGSGTTNYGVYGRAVNGTTNYAGYFDGTRVDKNASCVVNGVTWTATGIFGHLIATTYTASGIAPANGSGTGNTRLVNQGNNFNTANGMFTAPVSGFYTISLTVKGITAGRLLLLQSLNGGNPDEIYDEQISGNCTNCDDRNYSMTIYLQAGDTHRILRHSLGTTFDGMIISYRLQG
jgi:hypothetical protein